MKLSYLKLYSVEFKKLNLYFKANLSDFTNLDYLLFGLCFATLSTHFFCTYFNLVNFLPLSIGITSKFFILILLTKKSIKNILELQTIVPPTKNINFLTLGFTFKTSIKLYTLYFLLSVFFYFVIFIHRTF